MSNEQKGHRHQFWPTPNPKWLDLQTCSCGAIRSDESTFVPNAEGTALVLAPQPAAPAGEDCPCYAQSRSCDKWCPNHSGCKHASTPPTGTPEIGAVIKPFFYEHMDYREDSIATHWAVEPEDMPKLLAAIAKAYDARFEAAVGKPDNEKSAANPWHAHVMRGANNRIKDARARWYGPEQGGGNGK